MKLWVDIENSSGVKQGAGPIYNITRWRQTRRLNRAGSFRFEVPLSDTRAQDLLSHKRVARLRRLLGGTVSDEGAGIIDSIDIRTGSPSVVAVAGDDLGRELTYRTTGELDINEDGEVTATHMFGVNVDGSGYFSMLNAFDGNTGTNGHFEGDNNWFMYVGYGLPFSQVRFDIATFNTGSNLWTAQYFDGEAWVSLAITDNTVVGGNTMEQDGSITWTIPTDWEQLDQTVTEGGDTYGITAYWVRFRPAVDVICDIAETWVTTDVPTTATLAPIIALAPSGWALDGSGYSTTATAVYTHFQDETLLSALTKLAEITGENFRINADRTVRWLRTDTPSSGVLLTNRPPKTGSFDATLTTGLITRLERTQETYDLASRVIPYGAGHGDARLTLADTTRTAPAGYTLDTSGNYLIRDSTETTYGRIERILSLPDLAPKTTRAVDREYASNALYDAAYSWLVANSSVQSSYRLEIVGLQTALEPGQTVAVDYVEIVDSTTTLSVAATLTVLESTVEIDDQGVRTVEIVCSTVAEWPQGDDEIILSYLKAIQSAASYQQPLAVTQITSASGTPSGQLAVSTGGGGIILSPLEASGLSGGGSGGTGSHELASGTGLGSKHTVSGATSGHVLRATGATSALFMAIQDADIPATIVRTSRTLTASTGLTGGGDLSANRSFALAYDATLPVTITPDAAGAAGTAAAPAHRDHAHPIATAAPGANSVNLSASAEGSGSSFARADHTHQLDVSITPTWTGLHTFQKTTEPLRIGYDGSNYASFEVSSGGNLTIAPTGDLVFNPTGNDVLPTTGYDLNLGSLSKKFLTLHAAELWVETLVAQDTIATIGGRILIGPTTTLIADVSTGATTIDVKHNQMASGDRVYLEANAKVEFMAITSAPTTITGGYRYSVTRNLDGTGANEWNAGDAVFNTGTTGDGFIDLYSVRGVKASTQVGPTIVGNVRNSSTYNDWTEHWAVGNLNGLYGYGADTYGAAFGKYATGIPWVAVDATNGFRVMRGTTQLGQWDTSGNITVGEVAASKTNVVVTASDITFRVNTTAQMEISTDGIEFQSSDYVSDYQRTAIAWTDTAGANNRAGVTYLEAASSKQELGMFVHNGAGGLVYSGIYTGYRWTDQFGSIHNEWYARLFVEGYPSSANDFTVRPTHSRTEQPIYMQGSIVTTRTNLTPSRELDKTGTALTAGTTSTVTLTGVPTAARFAYVRFGVKPATAGGYAHIFDASQTNPNTYDFALGDSTSAYDNSSVMVPITSGQLKVKAITQDCYLFVDLFGYSY